jgi:hypothetical protein
MSNVDSVPDFGKYADDLANLKKDERWSKVLKQVWEDAQAALAAECDALCDCACCARVLREIQPHTEESI